MEDAKYCFGTVTIVSYLTLSCYAIFDIVFLRAILTMFQIPSAASDPVTRTAALLSLVCALMSLSYGCMYIFRFGTMRTMYKASRWAEVNFIPSIDMAF